jgi:hypothetical protein
MYKSTNKKPFNSYNNTTMFGSGESSLITDNVIKQKILDFLYSSLNLSKYRFIILNSNKLEMLKTDEHYVSPSFKGFNYLLLFTTINSVKYCVAIDRRKLSYHKDQIDIKTVYMVSLSLDVSYSVYDNTIIDGKLIELANKKYIFLIQDCFYLMGKSMLEMDMNDKLKNIDIILKTHFNNENIKNFAFKLNKLYKYEELEDLIYNIMPKCSMTTQGLVFYPKKSGIFTIYSEKKSNENINVNNNVNNNNNINNNNNNINNKYNKNNVNKSIVTIQQNDSIESKSYDIIYNFVDYVSSRTYSYEIEGERKVLWLTKSNIVDVYNISYTLDGDRFDIAHIPNIKISQMCSKYIIDKPAQFNCIYNVQFKKWIPLSIV